ncbi:MAG: type II secretion system inner membrane protein GspF [Magnetococcales bacterium]|nr:type II secretion system inner membrane protein GspF [Magnetococcales bacterium]
MGAFEYTALDAEGGKRKGVMEGDTPREVRAQLREQGLAPIAVISVRQSDKGTSKPLFQTRGVGTAELTLATRQLATLVAAGLPLEEALAAVSRQTNKKRLANVLRAVRAKVLEGHALAVAFAEFPHIFSSLFRETVAAGEQSGKLDGVLERLADYLENSQKLRQSVMLAMLYPLIVLVFALLVSAALLTFVVPEVVAVFEDFDQELPWLTQMLIAASDLLRNHGGTIMIGLGSIFLTGRVLLRQKKIRWMVHRLLLMTPLVNRLERGLNSARFVRTFGVLTASGVPVLEGLKVASRVVENLPMRGAVEHAASKVREGGGLSPALSASNLFSPLVVHLIASGETSGNLAGMLERAAQAQEREVESLVATLSALFEPLMILLMGGLVLTIVVAVLLPVFDLNQLIQ